MCQLRIRVPDQWYGDYLAMLASARIGERRLGALVARYGVGTIRAFVAQWLDYSEQMAAAAIACLPAGRFTAVGWFDPIPAAPDGLELRVEAAVDPGAGRIVVDLRDNPDCIPAGVNLSQATATNSAIAGVLAALGPDVPVNSGSFRRIEVLLRENCVVGIPRHPTSCSVATTLIADRLVNVTQAAFAGIGDGWGHAHGGHAMGPGFAVVSGDDPRRGGRPFINQLHIGSNGGPAGPRRDGWVTWALPVCAGLLYRDSVEIDEHKYPIRFESVGLVADSGGAGRHRGAPTAEVVFGPRFAPVSVIYPLDGSVNPARGVVGGLDGNRAHVRKRLADGSEVGLPPISREILEVGELIVGRDCGGGGYGPPAERDPERVLQDVLEGYVTVEAARETYRVAFTGTPDEPGFAVDAAATRALRAAAAG
ncbi:MAG: hydantoinase B/oxoprolinase family protein [Thermoleophilia bacterium]